MASTPMPKVNELMAMRESNCHPIVPLDAPGAMIPLYWKYCWPVAVKVPVPVAFPTVTTPTPDKVLGPDVKKTRVPLAAGVLPSLVPMSTGSMLVTEVHTVSVRDRVNTLSTICAESNWMEMSVP